MKATFAAFFCLMALNLNAQSLNPKYDIGLRIGSFQNEKLQLEYRYHVSEKWSLIGRVHIGVSQSIKTEGDYLIQDSLYQSFTNDFQRLSYGLSFGAQRRLNFMKHDFYYVGANLGLGTTRYRNTDVRMIYEPYFDQGISFSVFGPPPVGEVLERETTVSLQNAINVTNHIYVGADVPLVNHLSVNLEIGVVSALEVLNSSDITLTTIQLAPFVSGGLRYSFGFDDN